MCPPRRRAPRTASASAGFTLIELLVALALLGLLSLVLFSGLRQGVRSWDAVEKHSGSIESVARMQGLLRDRLAGAVRPEAEADAQAAADGAFLGGDARVSFVTPWLTHLPVGGLYRIDLGVTPAAAGGLSLRLGWRPAGEALPQAAARRLEQHRLVGERELVTGLSRVRFRYYGDPDGEGDAGWHPAWRSGTALPRLVRIEAEFADPTLIWPPLVVAIP